MRSTIFKTILCSPPIQYDCCVIIVNELNQKIVSMGKQTLSYAIISIKTVLAVPMSHQNHDSLYVTSIKDILYRLSCLSTIGHDNLIASFFTLWSLNYKLKYVFIENNAFQCSFVSVCFSFPKPNPYNPIPSV